MQQLQEFKLPNARAKNFVFDFDQASIQLFNSIKLELHNAQFLAVSTLPQKERKQSALTSISSVHFAN